MDACFVVEIWPFPLNLPPTTTSKSRVAISLDTLWTTWSTSTIQVARGQRATKRDWIEPRAALIGRQDDATGEFCGYKWVYNPSRMLIIRVFGAQFYAAEAGFLSAV